VTLQTVGDWVGFLSTGLIVTLQLALVTAIFSVILAAALALARISPSRAIRGLARLQVDLFRSIPLLALLLFMYFGIGPIVAKYGVNEFWVAVAALTLSESAYLAEVYRAALEAVTPRQWEAATSIGMGWRRTVRHVVVPQAILPSIPTTVNVLIAIIKDSSLASLIAVGELTLMATILVSNTFMPLEVYLVLAGVYLAIIIPLSLLATWSESAVERRLGVSAVRMRMKTLDISPELASPAFHDLDSDKERLP
jgi:His/Glu/Gln/Arg/opine family amino acid ABC transporter permease subunit